MQQKQKEYDVIVIGAGNGGLTAAAVAAKEGKKTLLVEQHNLPGGFATSFVRGRFEFEPSLHELCSDHSPGSSADLMKSLGADITWISVPDAYRLILTGKDKLDIRMPFGQKEYIDALERYVPGSRAKVEEFFDLCDEVLNALDYLGKSKGVADKKYLIKTYPNFLRTAAYSLDQVQDAMKIPSAVKDILNAYWCYLGIPTSRCNFTIFAAMFLKYIRNGAIIPKNRSHEVSAELDKCIRKLGGEIRYNTKVEKILIKDNKVQGILTDKGETIFSNHVIANISPHTVYSYMIEPQSQVPELAIKSLNARRVGPAGYVVYLGLDKSAEELGLEDYSYFIYDTMKTEQLYDRMASINGERVQATVCLNVANPDCSTKGTSIMSMTTLFNEGAWDNIKEEDYFKVKDRIAYEAVDYFEKATGIKIKDSIEEFEVATPVTFARYTGAFGGSIYGYEPDSWDSILPRTMRMEDEIFIKGLRFAGGSAFRAHGYSSSYLSGPTAALLTIKDMKEEK
jgi:prolycopene isomerase